MLAICLARAYELRLSTEVVRALDATLANRSLAAFKAGLLKAVVVSLGGSWLRIVYGYLQARLTWKWRRKLTTMCQAQYESS